MKTRLACVMVVALIALVCCLGNNNSVTLPGDVVGSGGLAAVWAANTSNGPYPTGQCTYPAGSFPVASCTSNGAPCGSYAGGTSGAQHLSCSSLNKVIGKKHKNDPKTCGTVTVQSCKQYGWAGATYWGCANPMQTQAVGTRDYCIEDGNLPKEP